MKTLASTALLLALCFANIACQQQTEEKSTASNNKEKAAPKPLSGKEEKPTAEKTVRSPEQKAPSLYINQEQIGDTTFVRLKSMPTSLAEHQATWQDLQNSPEGAAAAFVSAMHLYKTDSEAGLQAYLSTLGGAATAKDQNGAKRALRHEEGRFKEQLKRYPDLATAYVLGTGPDKGYALPEGTISFAFRRQQSAPKGEKQKLFIICNGADSDRPIKLVQDPEGQWRVDNYGSLLMGVKKPN